MPYTAKDKKILSAMSKTYNSSKRGKEVFFAMATAGKLGGEVQKRHGSQYRKQRRLRSEE